MDAVTALVRLGGVGDADAIIALSSRRRLRTALKRRQIKRATRNRYCLPDGERGAVAAAKLHGVASHLSAAAHWGWEIKFPPEEPQVSVRRDRKIAAERRVGVRLRWTTFGDGDIDGPATSRLRTVVDCARDLPFDEALAVADSALRHGDVTRESLVRAAEAVMGGGAVRARRVAAYADARSANPFESVLRALAIDAGLDVAPQVEVVVDGKPVHPDVADRLRRIALEADSWTWHASKDAHERDCWRYNALVIAGWVVLRFTWQQVMLSPAYVTWAIEALLEGPPRPARSADTQGRAA